MILQSLSQKKGRISLPFFSYCEAWVNHFLPRLFFHRDQMPAVRTQIVRWPQRKCQISGNMKREQRWIHPSCRVLLRRQVYQCPWPSLIRKRARILDIARQNRYRSLPMRLNWWNSESARRSAVRWVILRIQTAATRWRTIIRTKFASIYVRLFLRATMLPNNQEIARSP